MRNFYSFFILLILFASCNASRISVYKPTDSQIFFGSQGGFTNAKLEYVLNDDRNVFKIEKDSMIFIKKISNFQFQDIKSSIDISGFRNLQLNSPGNMSYFIRIKTNEYENKVVWSNLNTNNQVELIFGKLFESLKD
jgi:hypothetical protein